MPGGSISTCVMGSVFKSVSRSILRSVFRRVFEKSCFPVFSSVFKYLLLGNRKR